MVKVHSLLMMMISHYKFLIVVFVLGGCATAGELALNTAAGALGNMLDRRVEDKLGNDANMSDEKLDGKLSKKRIVICKKLDEDKYYECKNSKVD